MEIRSSLLLAALATLASNPVSADGRAPAPAADCLDARQMQEALLATPRMLAIALADGSRFRVDLGTDCPAAIGGDGDFELRSPLGWACSANGSRVAAADGSACPVEQVAAIDSKRYAELALTARALRVSGVLPPPPVLSTVEVRGERQRGFRGSTNYCIASRHVRSWSEDDEGMIIEVSPRRAAGNRYYRVELHGSCGMLSRSPAIQLRSGVGNGVICGFPGDKVELAGASPFSDDPSSEFANRQWPELEKSCSVLAVYPIARK